MLEKEVESLDVRRGDMGRGGGEGAEEGVVVPGHGGVVEERGVGWGARVFEGYVLCWAGEVFGV